MYIHTQNFFIILLKFWVLVGMGLRFIINRWIGVDFYFLLWRRRGARWQFNRWIVFVPAAGILFGFWWIFSASSRGFEERTIAKILLIFANWVVGGFWVLDGGSGFLDYDGWLIVCYRVWWGWVFVFLDLGVVLFTLVTLLESGVCSI